MSLRFNYTQVRMPGPALSLGGRWVRLRPYVEVTVIGPADCRLRVALLDPGSDETLFPEGLAAQLGVDLSDAPLTHVAGIGHGTVTARLAQVRLRISAGQELREWPAWVGFVFGLRRPLLGFAGCLQFFTAAFHGDLEFVELTINTLYPGT
jgi:hypothetical protein